MAEHTKLSSRHRVADYRKMEAAQDKKGISELIRLRLVERYVAPVDFSTAKHGFASIALACLLIETIQSFREGLPDTKNKSKDMFMHYFAQEARFSEMAHLAERFYYDVRCGVLHQGEARKGWTIVRYGPLFEPAAKRLNGTTFLRTVRKSVTEYCDLLRQSAWDGDQWTKCRDKMTAIIANCEA